MCADTQQSMVQLAHPSIYRSLVERVYIQWNPDKLASMDMLMNKFGGREAELLDQVVRKYIFTVRPMLECRMLIAEMLARFEPARLAQMDRLMGEHAGREGELYRTLCEKSLHRLLPGDAPLTLGKGEISTPASEAPPELLKTIYKRLVEQAYRRHRPEKLDDVAMLMKKYADYEGDLLDQIMRKYYFCSKREESEHIAVFAEFFACFAPSELFTLSKFLSKNRGSEWKAYRSLCQKYLPCQGATWQKPKLALAAEGEEQLVVPRKITWNVVDEDLEERRKQITLDVTLTAGPLGFTLVGAMVVDVAMGEQAQELGIKVGHKLFALNGQEPPKDMPDEELDDWVQVWFAGPRPLRAQFFDVRADEDKDYADIVGKDLRDADAESHASTEVSDNKEDQTSFMINDEEDEPCEEPDTDFEDVWDMDWSAVTNKLEHCFEDDDLSEIRGFAQHCAPDPEETLTPASRTSQEGDSNESCGSSDIEATP